MAAIKARGAGDQNAEIAVWQEVPSFAASTAEVMGVSERTVQATVQIASNLSEEARSLVEGTPLEDSKMKLLRVVQSPRDDWASVARSPATSGLPR